MRLSDHPSFSEKDNIVRENIEASKNEGSNVYTSRMVNAFNKNYSDTLNDKGNNPEFDQSQASQEFTRLLKDNKEYFNESETQQYQKKATLEPKKAIEELNSELKSRKTAEKRLLQFCSKYQSSPTIKNSKFQKMSFDEKEKFFEKLQQLEKHFVDEYKKSELLSEKRVQLSMKTAIQEYDIQDIENLIAKTKKLFTKENSNKDIFDEYSKENNLPFRVRKMSEASKNFYLEYYKDEDFELREKLINDWEIIVNHEDSLLKKFMEIFKNYPKKLSNKLQHFQDLDFQKKEKFIENAEITYPSIKTKKKTEKPNEKEKKTTVENNNIKEDSEKKTRAILEKESIDFALDSLKNEKPEDGLKSLLKFKRKFGNSAKINFHIKMILKYIEELEIEEKDEDEEEEKKLKQEKEKQMELSITEKVRDIFAGIHLRKIIKQERLIAKNIRGAMRSEALHKGEKNAINRAKKENSEKFNTNGHQEITQRYYENENDNVINSKGNSEKLQKLTITNSSTPLDSDEYFSLQNSTKKHELGEEEQGFSHINFYDNSNNIISAKEALEIEKSKIKKTSNSYSDKIIQDLQIKSSAQQIDLRALIEQKLFQESGLNE